MAYKRKVSKDWEDEFDEMCLEYVVSVEKNTLLTKIKKFIRKELTQARKEERERRTTTIMLDEPAQEVFTPHEEKEIYWKIRYDELIGAIKKHGKKRA